MVKFYSCGTADMLGLNVLNHMIILLIYNEAVIYGINGYWSGLNLTSICEIIIISSP